jgi:hypothetical protein
MRERCYFFHISPWRQWRWMMSSRWKDKRIGIFRNLPGVIPGRWGFFIFGLEIGSRQPGDPFGTWLKDHGLWPW